VTFAQKSVLFFFLLFPVLSHSSGEVSDTKEERLQNEAGLKFRGSLDSPSLVYPLDLPPPPQYTLSRVQCSYF
jgi:hypothetical protein